MRVVGLDIHRSFAEAAMIDGGRAQQLGRINLVRERVIAFAKRLGKETEVVVEATGNTMAVVGLMAPHVKRIVIANPLQVRAIAHAKVKTDKIDAMVLAKLHAAGFLPEVWQPDEATERLRRQVARRATIVQSRTRVKNRIQSVRGLRRYISGRLQTMKEIGGALRVSGGAEDGALVVLQHLQP
jgi:transposase